MITEPAASTVSRPEYRAAMASARIHRDDVAAVDRHRAVLDHAASAVDRDYDSVRDDQRDVAPARRLCGTKRNGADDDREETPHI